MTRTVLALFFIAMAILTIFSNTIQSAMLPKVATEKPWKKSLVFPIQGEGILVPRRQIDLTSDSGWKIRKVHVGVKDQVEQGQILVTFDSSEGERQREDAELQVRRLELNMEMLQQQYISAHTTGDADALGKAERDLKNGRLELEAAQAKARQLQEEISAKRKLTAPFDGRIASIDAEEGMAIPPGQKLLTLIKSGEGFAFSFSVPADAAAKLDLNEEIPVIVHDGEQDKTVNGTVVDIQSASGGADASDQGSGLEGQSSGGELGRRTITIGVPQAGLEGGEKVSVDMEKPAAEQGLVISKKWLRQDADGTYVFVVREERSALGNTYTVRKAYVATGDEVADEIAILRGLWEEDEVIAESSDPLQEGDRVAWNG